MSLLATQTNPVTEMNAVVMAAAWSTVTFKVDFDRMVVSLRAILANVPGSGPVQAALDAIVEERTTGVFKDHETVETGRRFMDSYLDLLSLLASITN
jgi:hypothetical protein